MNVIHCLMSGGVLGRTAVEQTLRCKTSGRDLGPTRSMEALQVSGCLGAVACLWAVSRSVRGHREKADLFLDATFEVKPQSIEAMQHNVPCNKRTNAITMPCFRRRFFKKENISLKNAENICEIINLASNEGKTQISTTLHVGITK